MRQALTNPRPTFETFISTLCPFTIAIGEGGHSCAACALNLDLRRSRVETVGGSQGNGRQGYVHENASPIIPNPEGAMKRQAGMPQKMGVEMK